MTKREALKYFKNQSDMARILGITRQAVSLWPIDGDIPELQEKKLKYEVIPYMNLINQKGAA